MKVAMLLVLQLILANTVFADKEKGFYAGAGIDLVGVGAEDIYRNGVTFKVGELQFGYKHNNWLIAELRAGASLNDEVIAYEESAIPDIPDFSKTGIDHFYSLYYRAEISNEIAKLYVLAGQTDMQTTSKFSDGTSLSLSDSGLSYGFGFGMWLDEKMNLNFEYKIMVETGSDSFRASTISADYRF